MHDTFSKEPEVPESDVMPIFAIKASDNLAPATVAAYLSFCEQRGLRGHAEQVRTALAEIEAWRAKHPGLCKDPFHEHAPAGSPGSGSEV